MSCVPRKYQPSRRLIDQPERLRELYCEKGKMIQEIADYHAQVGKTRVHEALDEYGIGEESESEGERGHDPPTVTTVDWSILT